MQPKKKSLKRKEDLISDSDYDVEQDVLDIMPPAKKRIVGGKKVPINVPETPIDNVSFHHVSSVEKLKCFYQRRLALEGNWERMPLNASK